MDDAALAQSFNALLSMGFNDTDSLTALLKFNNLEDALEYLCNNPSEVHNSDSAMPFAPDSIPVSNPPIFSNLNIPATPKNYGFPLSSIMKSPFDQVNPIIPTFSNNINDDPKILNIPKIQQADKEASSNLPEIYNNNEMPSPLVNLPFNEANPMLSNYSSNISNNSSKSPIPESEKNNQNSSKLNMNSIKIEDSLSSNKFSMPMPPIPVPKLLNLNNPNQAKPQIPVPNPKNFNTNAQINPVLPVPNYQNYNTIPNPEKSNIPAKVPMPVIPKPALNNNIALSLNNLPLKCESVIPQNLLPNYNPNLNSNPISNSLPKIPPILPRMNPTEIQQESNLFSGLLLQPRYPVLPSPKIPNFSNPSPIGSQQNISLPLISNPIISESLTPQLKNEDYKNFLRIRLSLKGIPNDCIDEIVETCNSKEEALLILDIPTYYKDTPLNFIPVEAGLPQSNQSIALEIKNELIKDGVDEETAEILALSCNSLEEAFENLNQSLPKFGTNKISVIPPMPAPKYQVPPFPSKYSGNKYIPPYNHPVLPPPMPKYQEPLGYNSSSSEDDFYGSSYINLHGMPGSKPKFSPMKMSEPSENDPKAPDNKTEYFTSLESYRLMMNDDKSVFNHFSFTDQITPSPQSLKRINTEIKTLSTSVPCDTSASIFVMVDSECMHRIKFLLSGTLDTPYAHGLYLFEVLLPSNYPLTPPKVSIITTGNGRVRFNPNLYSNGYVCLSIINTWSGRPEEM